MGIVETSSRKRATRRMKYRNDSIIKRNKYTESVTVQRILYLLNVDNQSSNEISLSLSLSIFA